MEATLDNNSKSDMTPEEMKVGPKGQVVIPKAIRDALQIFLSSKVLVRSDDGRVIIEKKPAIAVSVFEAIADAGPSIVSYDPHLYEEELRRRVGTEHTSTQTSSFSS